MHLTECAAVAIAVSMNELIEIRIDSLADSGEGVGRADGKVFFVAHSARSKAWNKGYQLF